SPSAGSFQEPGAGPPQIAFPGDMQSLAPVLTPQGHLFLAERDDSPALAPDVSARLQKSFARGTGHGLLQLGAAEVGTVLPPVVGYWRDLAARYVTAVCTLPETGEGRTLPPVPELPPDEIDALVSAAPPMTGAEYFTPSVLQKLWRALDSAFRSELVESNA